MAVLKRIFLFLIINILVMHTIGFFLHIFQVSPYLKAYGLDMYALLLFCFAWGMIGSFISLLLSKKMATWVYGVRRIDPSKADRYEKELLYMLTDISQKAGLRKTPDLGIYSTSDVNAFATGPTKDNSIVALSSGLIEKMDATEIKAIIGHEVSHIANGDMVTMTLMQGITNSFSLFLSRVISYLIIRNSSRRSSYGSYYLLTFLFDTLFMLLGSTLICFFSRLREYRADAKSADLTGSLGMIKALQKLGSIHLEKRNVSASSKALATLQISDGEKKKGGLFYLFATHPSIEDRIKRLKERYPSHG